MASDGSVWVWVGDTSGKGLGLARAAHGKGEAMHTSASFDLFCIRPELLLSHESSMTTHGDGLPLFAKCSRGLPQRYVCVFVVQGVLYLLTDLN